MSGSIVGRVLVSTRNIAAAISEVLHLLMRQIYFVYPFKLNYFRRFVYRLY